MLSKRIGCTRRALRAAVSQRCHVSLHQWANGVCSDCSGTCGHGHRLCGTEARGESRSQHRCTDRGSARAGVGGAAPVLALRILVHCARRLSCTGEYQGAAETLGAGRSRCRVDAAGRARVPPPAFFSNPLPGLRDAVHRGRFAEHRRRSAGVELARAIGRAGRPSREESRFWRRESGLGSG